LGIAVLSLIAANLVLAALGFLLKVTQIRVCAAFSNGPTEVVLWGKCAYWRRSLRPGMTAHFVQDTVGGLIGRHLLK
jgi:hypothetical protein